MKAVRVGEERSLLAQNFGIFVSDRSGGNSAQLTGEKGSLYSIHTRTRIDLEVFLSNAFMEFDGGAAC